MGSCEVVQGVREYADYFMCKREYAVMVGFASIQKCIVTLTCFAYGATTDTQ